MSFGKKNKQEAAAVYMPSQDPSWSSVNKELQDIIRQRGIGYSPRLLDTAMSPYAEARRYGIKTYETPAIASAASARGLNRSTIVPTQMGRAYQEGEQDIAQKIAQLNVESERLKAEQYQNALSQMQNMSSQEITAQNQARANAAAASNANRAAANELNQSILGTGVKTLAGAAYGGLTGGPVGALGGEFMGMAGTTPKNDFIDTIRQLKSETGAKVNIQGQEIPSADYLTLAKLRGNPSLLFRRLYGGQ